MEFMSWQRLGWHLTLTAIVLCNLAAVECYQGFDCGQGSALLLLASHSQCGSSSQVACFNTVAMKVNRCSIKAWPHKPHKHHRSCWKIQLAANVTNVNTAHGTLSGPVAAMGGGGDAVPMSLQFSRPDESMYLQFGSCSMRFDVQAATDASLAPVPGDDEGSVSSLLVLLLPAILVPCMCVGLIIAVGSITAQRMRPGSPRNDDTYTQQLLAVGRCTQMQDQAASISAVAYVCRHGNRGRAQPGISLFTRTFNLKAMGKRAIAKRLRRSVRPVYVGHPHEHAQQQSQYAAGKLQPGPCHLVAPCFRFPPVAVAPGLEAIPEACNSSAGPSSSPSRSGSNAADISMPASPTSQPAAAVAAAAVTLASCADTSVPSSGHQQQQPLALGEHVGFW